MKADTMANLAANLPICRIDAIVSNLSGSTDVLSLGSISGDLGTSVELVPKRIRGLRPSSSETEGWSL